MIKGRRCRSPRRPRLFSAATRGRSGDQFVLAAKASAAISRACLPVSADGAAPARSAHAIGAQA